MFKSTNLHAYVFFSFDDRHFDGRDVAALLMRFHYSSHAVLEQLEQYVIEMRRHIDDSNGFSLFKFC